MQPLNPPWMIFSDTMLSALILAMTLCYLLYLKNKTNPKRRNSIFYHNMWKEAM